MARSKPVSNLLSMLSNMKRFFIKQSECLSVDLSKRNDSIQDHQCDSSDGDLHNARYDTGHVQLLQQMHDGVALLDDIKEVDLWNGFTFSYRNCLQSQIQCIVDMFVHQIPQQNVCQANDIRRKLFLLGQLKKWGTFKDVCIEIKPNELTKRHRLNAAFDS